MENTEENTTSDMITTQVTEAMILEEIARKKLTLDESHMVEITTTNIDQLGRVVIPPDILASLGLDFYDKLIVKAEGKGERIVLYKKKKYTGSNVVSMF